MHVLDRCRVWRPWQKHEKGVTRSQHCNELMLQKPQHTLWVVQLCTKGSLVGDHVGDGIPNVVGGTGKNRAVI